MNRITLVEMKCSKCGGTIVPGSEFSSETTREVSAGLPPTKEHRLARVAAPIFVGFVTTRTCFECVELF